MATRCTALKHDGTPCRSWAVHETNPPRCAAHGGGKPIGAPTGNKNAQTHGTYSDPVPEQADIDERIADLNHRIQTLSAYIDDNTPGLDLESTIKLLTLHGQLNSRLGRLMRDRQILVGEDAGELQQAIEEALAIAGDILGVEL
jgi:hypothetical protein